MVFEIPGDIWKCIEVDNTNLLRIRLITKEYNVVTYRNKSQNYSMLHSKNPTPLRWKVNFSVRRV